MIKQKMIKAHLRAAQAYAETSYAVRLQVGAVIVNQLTDQPVSAGWNGMPPGEPNICEHEVDGQLVSKDNVVHAEINALSKIPVSIPRNFLTLFVTDSPCPVCAQRIVESGIRQVIFTRRYRLDEGINILLKAGIEVYHGSEYQLKSRGGAIVQVPAEYSDANILMCRNYVNGLTVKPYGLGNHNVYWSTEDIEIMMEMFNNGDTIEQIAERLDRSYSSICSRLCKDNYISWAANRGYMETNPKSGRREVWCSIYKINQNKKAIDDAVEELRPRVLEVWNKKPNIGTVMRLFPDVSPLFLKRICKVNNQ